MKKQTIAIHTPYTRPDTYGSPRISNPTVTNFEQRVKALTEAMHVTAFNSGMAAISTALLALVTHGKNIVTSHHLFGNTPLVELSGIVQELKLKARLIGKFVSYP